MNGKMTMRWTPTCFRLSSSVAITALLFQAAFPLAARAQPAPPPLPLPDSAQTQADQQPADQQQADPPERVGRIARINGTVSFHNQGDTQWSPASVNYPVASGNAFWTEPGARLSLDVSDSRIALAGGTEFDLPTLDANGLQGVAARGESYLHLRNPAPNEAWSVQTPRGLVRLNGPGRYDIVVGTTDDPTLVTVLDGSADIQGPDLSLQVSANQTASLTGADHFQGSIGPARRDPFLIEMTDAERPPARAQVPPQVATALTAMPGGDDLAASGSWADAPEYGAVWYPPVAADWVPYRQGHWAFVTPWGWTWIDNASWGFAPSHYGRWVEIGDRWGWTPGAVAVSHRPVYAPALVAFLGVAAGVAVGAAIASRSVSWVPLGPGEAYHPWYHASDDYRRQINVAHVSNVTTANNTNVTVNNFINRNAATAVPATAMAASRPVAALAQPVSPQQFAAARPVLGQQPIQPTAATAGVTPVVARQMNLAPVASAPRPAPGPAVRAQAPGPASGAFAPPAATVPNVANPGVRPPSAQPAGVPITPPLVTPGYRAAGAPPPPGAPAVRAAEVAHPPLPNPARPESVRPPAPALPFVAPSAPQPRSMPAMPNAAALPPRPGIPGTQIPLPQHAEPPRARFTAPQPRFEAPAPHVAPPMPHPQPPGPHVAPPVQRMQAPAPDVVPPIQHVSAPPRIDAPAPRVAPQVQHFEPLAQHAAAPPPPHLAAPPPPHPAGPPPPHEKRPNDR